MQIMKSATKHGIGNSPINCRRRRGL